MPVFQGRVASPYHPFKGSSVSLFKPNMVDSVPGEEISDQCIGWISLVVLKLAETFNFSSWVINIRSVYIYMWVLTYTIY